MNFLAHLVLSQGGDRIMAGNFFANHAKGSSWKLLSVEFGKGVLLHRSIDSFVDNHDIIREAKHILSSEFGKFKGVLLDVYWDHFLAKNFYQYCKKNREEFISHAHNALKKYAPVFHPNAAKNVSYMERQNWLNEYSKIDGINDILCQMSNRFHFKNPLAKGISGLEKNYLSLNKYFDQLWPELKSEFGMHPFFG